MGILQLCDFLYALCRVGVARRRHRNFVIGTIANAIQHRFFVHGGKRSHAVRLIALTVLSPSNFS